MLFRRFMIPGLVWMLASCSAPGPEKPLEADASATTAAELAPQLESQPVEEQEVVAEEIAPEQGADTPTPIAVPESDTAEAESKMDERAAQMYISALESMHAGNDAEAERQLLQMTLDYPELSGPHANLGILHFRAGKKNAAKSDFQKALSLNPASVASLNHLGIISREEGKFQEAYDYYNQALTAGPDYANAHLNLGILLDLYMGNLEEALVHYKQYQALTADVDETVRKWIVDLSRRVEK